MVRSSEPPVTEETVILPLDAVWRYEASGDDLGSGWRQPGFADGGWPSGSGSSFTLVAPESGTYDYNVYFSDGSCLDPRITHPSRGSQPLLQRQVGRRVIAPSLVPDGEPVMDRGALGVVLTSFHQPQQLF